MPYLEPSLDFLLDNQVSYKLLSDFTIRGSGRMHAEVDLYLQNSRKSGFSLLLGSCILPKQICQAGAFVALEALPLAHQLVICRHISPATLQK